MERQRPRYPPSGGASADLAPSTVISRPPRAPVEESQREVIRQLKRHRYQREMRTDRGPDFPAATANAFAPAQRRRPGRQCQPSGPTVGSIVGGVCIGR